MTLAILILTRSGLSFGECSTGLMASLKDFFTRDVLPGDLSAFEYQYCVAQVALIPWLDPHISLAGSAIGDFGCHQGGVLQAFREEAAIASGTGFDVDRDSIRRSPFRHDAQFRLLSMDILEIEPQDYQFDLILLRDVLEHTPDPTAILEKARTCLKHGGRIFVSFPPYYSPFGGHHHDASNAVRLVPFIHYLPKALFFSLIRLKDTRYMSAESISVNIRSARQTRLTLSKAERTFVRAGLRIDRQELFLFRPEFGIRYGVPSWKMPLVHNVPIVREATTLGAYYLLSAVDGH